jgi:DNA-3-methyladenine glycosylase I
MSGYCAKAPGHPIHHSYHATEYGFPVSDDYALFERLAMEIMQAGLSWEIVLKKRAALNKAFDRFHIKKVANYNTDDIKRLLADEGIIRNRLKIAAIIHNANIILDLKKNHGSLAGWIAAHHPLSKAEWVQLFKKTFKFTGGEIVGEFLMSIGYLPNAHHPGCPVYKQIKKLKPAWANKS